MSFREKSDWLSLISLGLMGIYFTEVARGLLGGSHPGGPYYFWLFWVLVGVLVVIQVVTHVVLAIRSPKDAQTPVDERERLIHLRALPLAYFVLLVGAFLTIGTMHMGFSTWQFAHCILFVLWIAELLRYGMRLYYHRTV
ncbi:MAG: hypothetical protein CFE44_02035 [Burkholderiales bacterium PBB4]|nr:MAG: hypothetical protein CFE44_02035 [Burkholderiales bacterium PBB4]